MISRTISRNPTYVSFSVKYRESFGRKFRDAVARTGHYVKPVRKYLLRNFLMAHYFYIIMITILASILLYPVKNEKYIDILFLATGAATQGGLNTVNLNDLQLYQHIVIYITTFITTPIAIHGTLAFVRLYWFERHFDGIRDSSKRNYKMRRTKTILGRELTARTMSRGRQRTGTRQFTSNPHRHDDFQEKLFSGKMVNRDERDSLADLSHGANGNDEVNGLNGKNVPDPQRLSWSSSNTVENSGEIHPSGRGLLFMEPKPRRHHNHPTGDDTQRKQPISESFARRRKSTDISPEDLYRSISMMKGQRQVNTEDEGPALVVAAPGERPKGVDDKNTPTDERDKNLKLKKKDYYDSLRGNTNEEYLKQSSSNGDKRHSGNDDDYHEDNQTENGGESDDTVSASDSGNSLSSTSTSSTSGIGDQQGSDSFPNSSSGNIRSDSMTDNSTISSNAVMTDDREMVDDVDRTPLEHSQNHDPKENRNGPSIQFDIAAPPRRKRIRNDKTPTRQARRHRRQGGVRIPRGERIGQRLKRRLLFAPIEKPRSKIKSWYGDNDKNMIDNMDDYFADDESDREDGRRSQDGASDRFLRANTFEQQPSSQDEEYPHLLDRSQSFDVGKTKDLDKLSTSPEFQRMIYEKWKKKNRNRKSILKPRIRNASISSPNVSGLRRFYSNPEDEDEENSSGAVSMDSRRPVQSADDINDENGEQDARNSLDEEAGYFGNELSFAEDAPRNRLSRTFSTNYLSWEPTVGRNSIFVGMTKEQKEELGGVEYRAIKLLCRILIGYYGGFWIMAFIFLVPWIVSRDKYKNIVRSDGVAPAWWGFFTSMSAFADLGFTLTPDSMMSFQTTCYPIIVMMWFVVIGNTGFPVLLRFIIWIMFRLSPDLSLTRESLGFLLDHPRRCFTILFPSAATWWLVVTLIGLNAIDLIIFVILDLGDSVLHHLSRGYRVLAGLFQAISTRTAGFQIVEVGNLHPAVQVSYMLMMYVSVMPLAISIRRTNVYEEQSLGVYDNSNDDADEGWDDIYSDDEVDNSSGSSPSPPRKEKRSTTSFIGTHLRRQLSFDLWFMFLGLFIICLAEGGKIRDPSRPEFSIFAILFEIVSAYGTVGLSLGYPNTDTSFSGQFTTLSKLIIIALLIRGRHRGLPYSLDRAIMLPSDKLDNIDRLQDIQMGRRVQREASADPVTAYFRSKMSGIKKGFRKMRNKTTDSDESLLHDSEDSPQFATDTAVGEPSEGISGRSANDRENPSGISPAYYNVNRNGTRDTTGEQIIGDHDEPKEDTNSLNDSYSQPQEPKSYFPVQKPSPTQEHLKRSPSDPLSGIPSQEAPASHSAPSLESYRLRPINSTHSN